MAITLTPDEEAVLFWLSSGTPLSHLSRLTGCDPSTLDDLAAHMASKLGTDVSHLTQVTLEFEHGYAPRPSKPWPERTMATLVFRALTDRDPEDIFIQDARGEVITAGDTLSIIARIRSALRHMGVRKGDTIAADSALRLETYLITLAAWMHGAVLIRLNSSANADVARAQLVRTPAKVVFTSRADELQDLTGAPRLVRFADETDKDNVCEFSDLVQAAPDPEAEDMTPADLQPTDLCLVSLTSGTTGHPKAVLLSHHAVWWGCDRALRKAAFSDQDVFCSATDFIGDCSTYMMTGVPLAARARVVIPRAAACTSPLEFIEDCMACNVNCALIVPAALRAVLAAGDRVSGPFLASLKYLISASAPFGEPLAQAFRAVSQAEIIEYLGSREYGGSLSARTLGTGVISAGGGFENETLLRIVDEAGRPSAIGETGRLLVVSLGMMDGYGLPEGRAPSAYHDARAPQPGYGLWYDTNDLASYTASGGIRIEGRNSDMMKSPDGQLVMPIEIENILHGDDRVREACVFSLKDANGLEYIAGAVIPKEPQPEDALEYALRQKVLEALGHLKTPRALMITDAFPRAAQNKPDKTALKSLFASNVNMAGA